MYCGHFEIFIRGGKGKKQGVFSRTLWKLHTEFYCHDVSAKIPSNQRFTKELYYKLIWQKKLSWQWISRFSTLYSNDFLTKVSWNQCFYYRIYNRVDFTKHFPSESRFLIFVHSVGSFNFFRYLPFEGLCLFHIQLNWFPRKSY